MTHMHVLKLKPSTNQPICEQ